MVQFVDDEFGEIVYFIEASIAVAVEYNQFEVLESSDLHCYIRYISPRSKGPPKEHAWHETLQENVLL